MVFTTLVGFIIHATVLCRRSARTLLFLAAVAPFSIAPAIAETAAKALFVSGSITVVKASGDRITIERGADIQESDTIVTGEDGRLHLRFTDGSYVALTPNSEFRIEAYRYDGQQDGNERLVMRLVKGGLRTVSGAIGKVHRAAYEMVTRAATIGIRGTEYTVLYLPDGSVTGTVGDGRIEACNAGGCTAVGLGQTFLALDANIRPQLTDKAAELRAPRVVKERSRQREDGDREPRQADKSDSSDENARSGVQGTEMRSYVADLVLSQKPGLGLTVKDIGLPGLGNSAGFTPPRLSETLGPPDFAPLGPPDTRPGVPTIKGPAR